MSNGQITNGQRSAHALTASTPTRSHRHAHPEQFATAHASPIPRALSAALVSWKGRQLWQIPPSLNGYRISLRSVRHASSL